MLPLVRRSERAAEILNGAALRRAELSAHIGRAVTACDGQVPSFGLGGAELTGDVRTLCALVDDSARSTRDALITEKLSTMECTLGYFGIVQHLLTNSNASPGVVSGWTSSVQPYAVFVYTFIQLYGIALDLSDPDERLLTILDAYEKIREATCFEKLSRTLHTLRGDLDRALTCKRTIVETADFDVIDKILAMDVESINTDTVFDWNAAKHLDHGRLFRCACKGGSFSGALLKCRSCSVEHCVDCHAEKTVDHVCTSANVLSVTEIAHGTVSCPRCLVAVAHSEGCDQMMCTQCRAVFFFSTGKLVSRGEALHNPYYLALDEAARREVRAALLVSDTASRSQFDGLHFDDPQFEIVWMHRAEGCFREHSVRSRFGAVLNELHHWAGVFRGVVALRVATADDELPNRHARVQFLLGRTVGPSSKPFTKADYEQSLAATNRRWGAASTRAVELAVTCNEARLLLISVVTDHDNLSANIASLVQMRAPSTRGKGKKRALTQ